MKTTIKQSLLNAIAPETEAPEWDSAWLIQTPSVRASADCFVEQSTTRTPYYLGAAACLLIAVSSAFYFQMARQPERAPGRALVLSVTGDVEVQRTSGKQKAFPGDILVKSDRIVVGPASGLDINVAGQAVRVLADTSFTISDLTRKADGTEKSTELAMDRGSVLTSVSKLATGDSFKVKTPTAIAGVRGTKFVVKVDGEATEVRLFEGAVSVQNVQSQKETVLEPGGSVSITGTTMEQGKLPPAELYESFKDLDTQFAAMDPALFEAADAIKVARTEEDIKRLYNKIEIIRMKDGREFRGVIASQVGDKMIIHTASGIHVTSSSEVEDVSFVTEGQ